MSERVCECVDLIKIVGLRVENLTDVSSFVYVSCGYIDMITDIWAHKNLGSKYVSE